MAAEKKEILNGTPCCCGDLSAGAPEEGKGTEGQCAERPAERHTERSEEAKKKLIHRLNRVEGQIRGIRQMIENDAYCNDVLIQSAAAGAALGAFNRELIGAHLKGCVTSGIREGRDEVVDELLETLRKLMK